MRLDRLVWVLGFIALLLAVSVYFSKKKIDEKENAPVAKIVIDSPSPEPIVDKDPKKNTEDERQRNGPLEIKGCTIQSEFTGMKATLGRIVNSDFDQHRNAEFSKLVDQFRLKSGLPLPISIGSGKLNRENVVYNNCRSTCNGSVREVFVSQVINGRFIEVLDKNGSLKKLPLHESGLELASVDELNKKGIPFRSWLAPVSANDWYVKDDDLYYSLDISGLWLKIDPSSNWEVIDTPSDLTKLKNIDEPLRIPGCNQDESCFESGTRHFKAPRICNNS